MTGIRSSGLVLIAVNCLPLIGVWFFDWSTFDVVFLYWAENVIIGGINVLRMLTARPGVRSHPSAPGRSVTTHGFDIGALFLVPFFAVHYGMFCFGHQVFIVEMFGKDQTLVDVLGQSVIWLGILSIAASHLFSFVSNFLLGGEYRRTDARSLMMLPYERIIVLHVAILLGGFLLQELGEPSLLLLVLIGVKTLIDWKQHERERAALALEQ